jgi:hypothetical protein
MSDPHDPSGFERRTKALFDASVAALDAAARSRLTQARHKALEAQSESRGLKWALVPAGALAAAGLVAWVVLQAPPATRAVQAASLNDLEILLGEEDLELLEEELEFYGWLEEQPELAASDSVG